MRPSSALPALFGLLALLLTATGCQEAETAESDTPPPAASADLPECDPDDGSLVLPDGFCAVVVADELGRARHLTVDEQGDVYVALREVDGGGSIVALRDTDGDGRADTEQRFGDTGGDDVEIRDGHLYFGAVTDVWRFPLGDDELAPAAEAELLIGGFPRQGSHQYKPFALDGAGNIYVNVGAPSNACQEQPRSQGSPGLDPCPQLERQGGIWRFDANATGQTQQANGQRYATGIRNAVALDWDDATGSLYAVQHGRDQLHMLWPDIYTQQEGTDLPAEEFFQVSEGDNFGWPYCYYDQTQGQKDLAPEYGGDGQTVGRCAEFEDPIMAFPGHWAPNDLLFYDGDQFPQRYRNGAFIAWHGSWNRQPRQAGFHVTFVPFEGGQATGDSETFADGFAGEDDWRPASPGNAEYRPMGLATGPDGSLYISDSQQGRVWRVVYTGE